VPWKVYPVLVVVPHCEGGTGVLVSGFKSCIKIRAGSRLAEISVLFNDEAMSDEYT